MIRSRPLVQAFVVAVCSTVLSMCVSTNAAAQSASDLLSGARQAYNAGEFTMAITLSAEARLTPTHADAAALVMARALLERFRQAGQAADVESAREALLSVNPDQVSATEQRELRLGVAQLLFVDEQFGAAAELFESALDWPATANRERLLEWWASAVDRYAQLAPDAERQSRYGRLLSRLEREAAGGTPSPVVAYWLAASARGTDDPDRAWALAIAGWVQAPMLTTGEPVTRLRSDLDRLMHEAIIPERARRVAPGVDVEAQRVLLEAEWKAIKDRWRAGS